MCSLVLSCLDLPRERFHHSTKLYKYNPIPQYRLTLLFHYPILKKLLTFDIYTKPTILYIFSYYYLCHNDCTLNCDNMYPEIYWYS